MNADNKLEADMRMLSMSIDIWGDAEISSMGDVIDAIEQTAAIERASKSIDTWRKELASERRRVASQLDKQAKASLSAAKRLSSDLRAKVLQYCLLSSDVQTDAAHIWIDAERKRLRDAGDNITAEMLMEPAMTPEIAPGTTIGCRKNISITDVRELLAAIDRGELPPSIIDINMEVARSVANSGKAMPGLRVDLVPYIVIKESENAED